jgi:hypothetical protein
MISNRGAVEDVKQYNEIFEWVCRYADEMDGPTPSINQIVYCFLSSTGQKGTHIVPEFLSENSQIWLKKPAQC